MTSSATIRVGAVLAARDHVLMGQRRRGAVGRVLLRIGAGREASPPAGAERIGAGREASPPAGAERIGAGREASPPAGAEHLGRDPDGPTRAAVPGAVDDAELDTLRAELVRELARLAGPARR